MFFILPIDNLDNKATEKKAEGVTSFIFYSPLIENQLLL